MSGPRHLWSGEWRRESADAAAKLARLRSHSAQAEPAVAPAAAELPVSRRDTDRADSRRETEPARAGDTRRTTAATWRRRRLAAAALAVVVLVAGGAYGLAAALGSGGRGSGLATATGQPPWIGVQMQTLPVGGAVVVTVLPGGPADAAGVEPGDVITTLDNRPVNSAADVSSALAGMHPGDEAQLGISRGSTLLTIPVTLASRPPGSP